MPKGKRSYEDQSSDPAAQQMLIRADELGIGTAFSRADDMVPCNIGGSGMCCKQCGMGPCRLTKEGQVGVCGATIDTIQARNLLRAIAAGSASHSDHGRDMAFTLKAVAEGTAEGYTIRDVAKLRNVASYYDIPIEKRSPLEIANDLADLYAPVYYASLLGIPVPVLVFVVVAVIGGVSLNRTAYGRYVTKQARCARGDVHAKTGSLFDTIALSGLAETTGGDERLFSILVNDRPQRYSALSIRQVLDGLTATITGCWN